MQIFIFIWVKKQIKFIIMKKITLKNEDLIQKTVFDDHIVAILKVITGSFHAKSTDCVRTHRTDSVEKITDVP